MAGKLFPTDGTPIRPAGGLTGPRRLLIHRSIQGDDPRLGLDNVNGPSLIRVPDWLPNALGRYYLYFAHHQGKFIRMAYADVLEGPWHLARDGVLRLEETVFRSHIASPDVHVESDERRIRMFFHGPRVGGEGQGTAVAVSRDGLTFRAGRVDLGTSYFRVFAWNGACYASAFNQVWRGEAPDRAFRRREQALFPFDVRHTALKKEGDRLTVFYSRRGDAPEHILKSTIHLGPDWRAWTPSPPESVIRPVHDWEGAQLPVEPSRGGSIHEPVHQLRDPAIYEEDGKTSLLYSCAGEDGIAVVELLDGGAPRRPS